MALSVAPAPSPNPVAAVYCRISSDSSRTGLGVARQERDARALAESRGWTVRAVFVDNDSSASGYSSKRRPEFDRLMTAVAAEEFDVILAWDLDRITRRPAEAERMWDALLAVGEVRVSTVSGDDIDLSSGDGLMIARIKLAVAAEEVRKMSQRIRRKHQELAERGKPGGQARTFGYDRPRTASGDPVSGSLPMVIDHEAERIREAARRVLAGETLSSIRPRTFMPKGSFGNLIALPLHGGCRKRGTTVFLDRARQEHLVARPRCRPSW